MKLLIRIVKILAILIAILLLVALGWFAKAMYESRVVGDRPVYLQMGSPDSMVIRWGTETPSADTVFYGRSPQALSQQISESEQVVNHRVQINGLSADTRYYYRIRHQGKWLSEEANWFVTSPPVGKPRPTRVWLLGDPGKPFVREAVRDAGLNWLRQHKRTGLAYADLVITTGDNAYPSGTNSEYLRDFFLPYRQVIKDIPVWPAFGNHDARRWTFYDLFDRPDKAQLGGTASGTVRYFSFDYAQTHFVFPDSHDGDLSPGSEMLQWLQADLRATKQKWIVVVMHHPPYTKGTYNSDHKHTRRDRMRKVRENMLPILEQAGVDLVITGHSHVYERSHLIHCHYGKSDSFTPSMILDQGEPESAGLAYTKPGLPRQGGGTIYMVLGSSGEGNRGPFDHPALPFFSEQAGTVVLDLDDTLTSRYVTQNGEVFDTFSLSKQADAAANVQRDVSCF